MHPQSPNQGEAARLYNVWVREAATVNPHPKLGTGFRSYYTESKIPLKEGTYLKPHVRYIS